MENSPFDPDWRDDIFDENVVDIPLILPDDTLKDFKKGVWIQSKFEYKEFAFDQKITNIPYRRVKYLLKKSDLLNYHVLIDSEGHQTPMDSFAYDIIFPPQAWMSDSLEERCMVHAAAQQARGKILVGGLGFAIYPQFCFYLNRPVESITIIEKEDSVIDLVMNHLKNNMDKEKLSKIKLVKGTVEQFLQETPDQFDTIYLDIWDNMDPRYLAAINHLIQLANPKCAMNGQIHCWGYARIVDTFIDHINLFAQKKFNLSNYNLDPVLEKFNEWLMEQDNLSLPQETIQKMARQIATTVAKPLEAYERHLCLTPFARSYVDMQNNLIRARKSTASSL